MKIAGVTAAWDRPAGDTSTVVVLAHGAGGDLNDAMLRGVGGRLATGGIAVLRFNFPYRDAGRKAPGSQKQAEECYASVLDEVRGEAPRVFCGGKSYGGRMATHIAAAGAAMDGLVLLSYPLHPPGKPDRLRDAHLGDISVPMLFVQGTRDPFATPDLFAATVKRLGATHTPIEGGDHSLRVKGRPSSDTQDDVARSIAGFVG